MTDWQSKEDNDTELAAYLFEDIQKEVQSWLNVYSDLQLNQISMRDMRFFIWLKTLMDKLDVYETEISDLNKQRNIDHWAAPKLKNLAKRMIKVFNTEEIVYKNTDKLSEVNVEFILRTSLENVFGLTPLDIDELLHENEE